MTRPMLGVGWLAAWAFFGLLAPASLAHARAPQAVGFGSAARGGTRPCRVEAPTAAALAACARQPGALITFDQPWTIQIDRPIRLANDQTVQGPVKLVGSGLLLLVADVSDVVLRQISFASLNTGACASPHQPADVKHCGIPLLIKGRVRDVWIDRNAFTHCGEKCLEIWNESLAPLDASGFSPTPDLITLSNNRFTDSYFCVGVGVGATTPARAIRPGGERVTVVGNTFDRCFRRSVRAASGAQVDEVGNLIARWGPPAGRTCRGEDFGFGPSAVGGAQILLEANTFQPWPDGPCKEAVDTSDYEVQALGVDRGRGAVRAVANRLLGGATASGADPNAVFSRPYALTARPP
jgi:pectate lyase